MKQFVRCSEFSRRLALARYAIMLSHLTFLCLFSFVVHYGVSSPLFDTAHYLCSAPVDISQLKVQFIEVNITTTNAPTGPFGSVTYMLINVTSGAETSWDSDSEHKWCLFQLNWTQPSFELPRWVCNLDSIIKVANQLFARGQIASMHNVTDREMAAFATNNSYNMKTIRKIMNCNKEQSKAVAQMASQETNKQTTECTTTTVWPTNATIASSDLAALQMEQTQTNMTSTLTRVKRDVSSTTTIRYNSTTGQYNITNGTYRYIQMAQPSKPLGIIMLVVLAAAVFLILIVYWYEGPKHSSCSNNQAKPVLKSSTKVSNFFDQEPEAEARKSEEEDELPI